MIFTQLSPGISIAWNSFGFGLWRSGWCEPRDFLQTTEAAGAKRFTRGGKTTWRSVLPHLYQVLIEDLNFYILCSRPCRALEKVSKIGDFKILIWMVQTIQYVRVMPEFKAVVFGIGSFSSHCWFCLTPENCPSAGSVGSYLTHCSGLINFSNTA